MEKMAEYKLTIVLRDKQIFKGMKQPIKSEREICVVGYFNTERELQQWAENNLGEIDKISEVN